MFGVLWSLNIYSVYTFIASLTFREYSLKTRLDIDIDIDEDLNRMFNFICTCSAIFTLS